MVKKTFKDPVTGDPLSFSEYISWIIQGVIRRWLFLVILTIITILVWSTNHPIALLWWNLGASYLAIVIESIVGIALFSQTRRDAVALREVRAMAQHLQAQDEELLKQTSLLVTLLQKHEETNGKAA